MLVNADRRTVNHLERAIISLCYHLGKSVLYTILRLRTKRLWQSSAGHSVRGFPPKAYRPLAAKNTVQNLVVIGMQRTEGIVSHMSFYDRSLEICLFVTTTGYCKLFSPREHQNSTDLGMPLVGFIVKREKVLNDLAFHATVTVTATDKRVPVRGHALRNFLKRKIGAKRVAVSSRGPRVQVHGRETSLSRCPKPVWPRSDYHRSNKHLQG